jgi:hypothetical protein
MVVCDIWKRLLNIYISVNGADGNGRALIKPPDVAENVNLQNGSNQSPARL